MAITSAIANSFKVEILQGGHNFNDASGAPTGNTFKLALYSSNSATLSKSTTAYAAPTSATADPTSTYEVTTNSSGYTGGGNTLTASADPVLSSDTAVCDFTDISFTSATISAQAAVIYNSSTVSGLTTNASVCVLDFGAVKTSTSGTFTITFPAAEATAAILRIA